MRNYGYIKSELRFTDIKMTPGIPPREYKLKGLPSVRDQGEVPKCVSCVMTDILNWRLRYKGTSMRDDSYFYDNRPSKSIEGMSPKDAFKMLSNGIHDSGVNFKSRSYSRLCTIMQVRYAIVNYGPVLVALPASSNNLEFWKGFSGNSGHAVSFVGYDQDYFIIRNSWGVSWGDEGYIKFPVSDFNRIYEAWTLMD